MYRSFEGRWVVVVAVLAVALLSLSIVSGCGGDTTTTSAASTETAGGFVFGESNPVASNQNQIAYKSGKEQMAAQLNSEVKSLDANLSADKQVADIDTFIQMGVNGVTSWTLDQGAATAVYKRAIEAGIPVVTENSPGDFVSTVFATECYVTQKAQEDAAKYISERIPNAKILIIGGEPVPYITYVTNNMIEMSEKYGLEILETQDNLKDVASNSQMLMQDMLTKHPDVQAVWAFNDPSALGASAAIRAAGLKVWKEGENDGIIVIGMNGSTEAAEAISAGVQTATYDPNSAETGAAEIELLYRVASGQMAMEDMPAVIAAPYTRYDASNIADYVKPLERKVSVGILDTYMANGTSVDVIQHFLDSFKTQ